MSQQFYEEAIRELERRHALSRPSGYKRGNSHPFEEGTPVYCQWNDMYTPEMHGRWLPGTVDSYELDNQTGMALYHILFDNEELEEWECIPEYHVMDRSEYHELMRMKYQNPLVETTTIRPVEELYNLFLKKDNIKYDDNDGNGYSPPSGESEGGHQQQHSRSASQEGNNDVDGNDQAITTGQLDLLSTASRIRTHGGGAASSSGQDGTTKKKRESTEDIYNGGVYKRQMTEKEVVQV